MTPVSQVRAEAGVHADGVREALNVFDAYQELGREAAFARALVAYRSWEDRQAAEERRHARARDEMPFDRGPKVSLRVVEKASGDPAQDLDRFSPDGRERL